MKDIANISPPKPLLFIKYLISIHLVLFVIVIILATQDGQEFQFWWAIHLGVIAGMILYPEKYNTKTYYSKLIYFIALPTLYLYKFLAPGYLSEIEIIYWILNVTIAFTLYLAAPLLFAGRNQYLGVKNIA